jgi:membrane dipeptidase
MNSKGLLSRGRRIHETSIVVDAHLDVPLRLSERCADLGVRGATPHFDIPRAREGGLTAAFFAILTKADLAEAGAALREALKLIDLVNRAVNSHPAELEAAASAADIRRIKKTGKMAVLMGLEGGHAIEDTLDALRDFYRLGVRYMTLTHFDTNAWADSSGRFYLPDYDPNEAQLHHGLTDFGREVVREMNRLGMMVDVSHASAETVDDVLAVSRAPIFASHSSCRALSDVPRNLSDDQIRRIAETGGVIMINFSSYFLDQKVKDAGDADIVKNRPDYERIKRQFATHSKERDAAVEKFFEGLPAYRAHWTKVIDHIEHVIKVAGPGAVGLGTDFDGVTDPPEGLEDVSQIPKITVELLRRGHSEEMAIKVLGENFLKFFARVEEARTT